jgi:nicotinamidase-related amidase
MITWAGVDVLDTLDELMDPKHTALVMWDFAERIVGNAFNAESLVQHSGELLASARRNGVRIFYSRQNNMNLMGDTGAPTLRMRMHRGGKGVASLLDLPKPTGQPGQPKLVASVAPQDDDIIFEKFSPNAFLGTGFEWWLKKFGIKTIVLTGVNIATGISGTAREAINLGYYAVVAKDCCGTATEKDWEIAVASMERLFDVLTADEIIEIWDRSNK